MPQESPSTSADSSTGGDAAAGAPLLAPLHASPIVAPRDFHQRRRARVRLLTPIAAVLAIAACFALPFIDIEASTLELSFQLTLLVTFVSTVWLYFQLTETERAASLTGVTPPLSSQPAAIPRQMHPPVPSQMPRSLQPVVERVARPASAFLPGDGLRESTPSQDSEPGCDPHAVRAALGSRLEIRPESDCQGDLSSGSSARSRPGPRRPATAGSPEERIGQQVGSYRLEKLIGRGGMGEVYRGRNLHTGEIAAIKLLRTGLAYHPSAATRFLREVKLAASLDAANVIRVLEVGGEECPEPYLAMEYLEGRSLADYLSSRPRLTLRQTTRMVEQLGRGIHAAGRAGIVHRDLKPQNVFLAKQRGGRSIWKILDFGVSTLSSSCGTLTQGRVIGTPAYMAPEQARGRAVDHRADLYALAAIVYRALTGRAPFHGDGVPAILHSVVFEMPPRPSDLVDLPGDIDALLAIGMAKDPDARFPSARDLCEAFKAAVAGELPTSLRRHAEQLLAEHPWRDE